MSSAAIAFLAGMGDGYHSTEEKKKDRARQDAKDKRETDLHDANMAEIRQKHSDREALRDAGAPVAVTPDQGPPTAAMLASQDPLAATQPAIGYTAGKGGNARSFATQAAAQGSADAQNANPDGARTRTMAALAAQGNLLGADQLKTSGLQGEVATMTLAKGKREEANNVFDQGIRTALQTGGPEALAEFMSNSTADGKNGAVKFKAVSAMDGKSWQMQRVAEDGSMVPFGKAFPSDEAGMAEAGMLLSRSVPDSEKTKHLLAVKEAERKGKHDTDTLKITQQNADTLKFTAESQDQARKDAARHQRAMEGIAASKGAKADAPEAAFDPRAGFDSKKAQAVAFEQVSKEVLESAANNKPMSIQEQGKRAQEIYRAHEDAFAGENIKRERARVFKAGAMEIQTPEQLEEFRARASKSGYTPEEMAGLDPRFAIKKPEPAKPSAATMATKVPAARAPAYTPIPGSPAALAVANRAAQQEGQKTAAANAAAVDEQRRLADAEEAAVQAALYRQRNQIK